MKKLLIVACVVAMSVAACGKKKDAAAPTAPATMEPATDAGSAEPMPAGDDTGSGSAEAPAPGM